MDVVESLNCEIVDCRKCPRLVAWREEIAAIKKRAHLDEEYWGRPVPLLGDHDATRLIVGLAPAAHGANRTGQMFTGDRSGEWLFRALYKAGVASQPQTFSRFDGMRLKGALIAASAHCAPPANKPTPEEVANCSTYLTRLIAAREWVSVLCLGSIAWNHVYRLLQTRPPKFGHAVEGEARGIRMVASYHPSQQNTFTGKLTEPMLNDAIARWLS